ncbi:MAG: hypothetical protein KH363_00760 [Streptococcus parasanguinis]|uniref:Uncharacterized protein n=1 Tax=Streptococcus parasanguinis TaxID=1318 RepID=A0A943STA5_STRPA|nr:hypothetical protein [Streptococcus parasanguinis]
MRSKYPKSLFAFKASKMPYVDGNYVSFICNLQQSPRLLKLCGGGTTKSNSNELPISVPLSFY